MIVRSLAASGGAARWLGAMSRQGAILAYHGVVPDGLPHSSLHVAVGKFAAQLEEIRAMRYTFVSLGDMLERLRSGRSVSRCVAVTFDDAYAGLHLALPVLQGAGAPATVFVPTGTIGSGKAFWWDRLDHIVRMLAPDALTAWARSVCSEEVEPGNESAAVGLRIMSSGRGRLTVEMERAFRAGEGDVPYDPLILPMSWDSLREWLRWDGATCAPHTIAHPVLPLLPGAAQREEIASSHARLLETVDRVLPIIAYPYGLYDGVTIEAARDAGMSYGVTMDRVGCGARADLPLRVPRLPFGGTTPVERMGLYLSAPWRWYRRRDWQNGFPALPGARAAR